MKEKGSKVAAVVVKKYERAARRDIEGDVEEVGGDGSEESALALA